MVSVEFLRWFFIAFLIASPLACTIYVVLRDRRKALRNNAIRSIPTCIEYTEKDYIAQWNSECDEDETRAIMNNISIDLAMVERARITSKDLH